MVDIVTDIRVWDGDRGYPTPGVNPTQFKVVFSRLPTIELFCNAVTIPSINLGVAHQTSPLIDMKQVGEKLVYSNFTCRFILDSELKNYKEIYKWMFDLSVQGLNKDTTSNCKILMDAGTFNFINVFPTMIGPIEFDATMTDIQFPSCEVVFECDKYEIENNN